METLRVPATVASLVAVAEFIGGAVAVAGLGDKDAYRLRLAVDELITNVITHGYPPASAGEIELHSSVSDGWVLFLIVDFGTEFDPTSGHRPIPVVDPDDLPVGGFGLSLARMSADRLIYERVGGLNRTIVVVRRSGRDLVAHDDRRPPWMS
ncbi:ATP-binding protein [Streptosporangium sandarakinum]